MKAKLAIVLSLSLFFLGATFRAQEKDGGSAQKWRILHNERDGCPMAVGLASDNSILFNEDEIRAEVLFLFEKGVMELTSNYGQIEIRTGDVNIIPDDIQAGTRTAEGAKPSPPTQIISVFHSIKWKGYRGGNESHNASMTHRVVWNEATKRYYLQPAFIQKADNGSRLRDFFDIEKKLTRRNL